MNKAGTSTLDRAVAAIRELPEETQEAVARELLDRAGWLSESLLSDEQHVVVEERLSKPRTLASPEEVAAVFRKYCPGL